MLLSLLVGLCSLIASFVLYQHRLKAERKLFNFAVNPKNYEFKYWLKYLVIGGIIGSVITLVLGTTLTMPFIICYEILALISLLLLGLGDFSSFSLIIAVGLMTCLTLGEMFDNSFKQTVLNHLAKWHFDPIFFQKFNAALISLVFVYYILKVIFLDKIKLTNLSPRIKIGKRGHQIACYRFKETTVIPLLLLVPGDQITHLVKYWPVLSLPGGKVSLFVFPLILTGSLKIVKQLPKVALRLYQTQMGWLALVSLIVLVASYIEPICAPFGLLVILVLEIFFQVQRRKRDAEVAKWVVQTGDGARIIAVKSDTPAAKMNLQPGDIILTCNNIPVSNEREFYAALQKNPTYCHLKLMTYDGDLKLAESAIYVDSPHELGLFLFN